MKELYFITLIGNINVAAWVIFSILCIAAFVVGIAYFLEDIDAELLKKISKPMIIVSAICLLLGISLPSKQDAYIIVGIGSVVDYIQDNDEARQLPAKTVKMLNALADKYTEETRTEETR